MAVSCKKENPVDKPTFRQALVLGNSITIHPPLPSIGWFGNWGMAASTKDKDFVHILSSALHVAVVPVNLSEWEALTSKFDLTKLDQYFISKPDLIIIRFGENINGTTDLKTALQSLISYIKSHNMNAKLLVTGRFWKNDDIDAVFSFVAKENNIPFVKLNHLEIGENVSTLGASVMGEDSKLHPVTNQGVANHPGDLGMKRIAESILAEINNF
ncbi:MAG: SGNH/GDSL hydrolase family protein [Pedobacter sp.]